MRDFLHDLALSALLGLAVSAVLFAVLFTGGFLLQSFRPREGLAAARSGLLVTGALGLFICAGLLIRPQKGEQIRENPQWKQRFRVFGLLPVIAIVAVVVLALACGLDYILYF